MDYPPGSVSSTPPSEPTGTPSGPETEAVARDLLSPHTPISGHGTTHRVTVMRLAASLAIIATGVAAGLTIVAVHVLGESVEAHPITRFAVTQVGWFGYVALSLAAVTVGIKLLALFPFAEWGIRFVALAKLVDATRDAWLVAGHPAIGLGAVGEVSTTLVAIGVTVVLAQLFVHAEFSVESLDPEPVF